MIVVTGANGLIGHEVCRYFEAEGFDVLRVVKPNPIKLDSKSFIVSDLTSNTCDFFSAEKSNWSILIHTAAIIPKSFSKEDTELAHGINRAIDTNVINLCKENNIPICYMSSTSIFGNINSLTNEKSPVRITNLYSKGKHQGEEQIKKDLNKYCILRINAPYGKRQQNKTVFKLFIDSSLANKDIILHGTGSRLQDFTHVRDIAKACYSYFLNINKTSGTYIISGGAPISMHNFAKLILSANKKSTSKIKFSENTDSQENYRALFSIKKAESELNWYPEVELTNGISEWINYLNTSK